MKAPTTNAANSAEKPTASAATTTTAKTVTTTTTKVRRPRPEPFDKEKLKAISRDLYYGDVTDFEEFRKKLGLDNLGRKYKTVYQLWGRGGHWEDNRKMYSPELQELLSCLDLADSWYFSCRFLYKRFIDRYGRVKKDYQENPGAYADDLSSSREDGVVPLQVGTGLWIEAMPQTVKSRFFRGCKFYNDSAKRPSAFLTSSWTDAEMGLFDTVWVYNHGFAYTSEKIVKMTKAAVKKYLASLDTKAKKTA